MPMITDAHIATYRRQGFAVVPGFLPRDQVERARAGYHACFAPTYEDYIAGQQPNREQALFPWDHSAMNQLTLHPEIISAAERIIGTSAVRLSDCDINVRYAGEGHQAHVHVDQGNNTLGPVRAEDHANITFVTLLSDVQPGMSPTRLFPWSRPDDEAVDMALPAGSLFFYSTHTTRHTVTPFTAPAGMRAAMWIMYCRQDQPWDCARPFTYKWCGGHKDAAIRRVIAESTPRQLEMLGFPELGAALWTEAFIRGMAERYPGFDTGPYIAALERRGLVGAS
ncbi:MAG: phytanoyl-CoA dioxygenase family protein [Planctomycetes bacterium]|nr:phytanoyl-CoA dioxygenase family protein [Planctomycetota bacterium]